MHGVIVGLTCSIVDWFFHMPYMCSLFRREAMDMLGVFMKPTFLLVFVDLKMTSKILYCIVW